MLNGTSERRNADFAKQMEITTAGFIRIRIKNFLGYIVAVVKANKLASYNKTN